MTRRFSGVLSARESSDALRRCEDQGIFQRTGTFHELDLQGGAPPFAYPGTLLLAAAFGKARGHALRLALVLETHVVVR